MTTSIADVVVVGMTRWSDILPGTLERPSGKRLITVTMKAAGRMDPGLLALLVNDDLKVFTVRHAPGLTGAAN